MSSIFDPAQYLDSTTTEAAEKRDPLPATQDWIGEITDVKSRASQGKKDPSQTYLFFDYAIVVNLREEYPEVASKIGVEKLNLKYGVSVDLTENGAMDWGKGRNSGLRIIREATGTNEAGKAWNARMPIGHRVRIKIKHREYPEGSGNMIEDVASLAKV